MIFREIGNLCCSKYHSIARVCPGRPASHEDAENFANGLIRLADHYPSDGVVSLDELLACEKCLSFACDGSEYSYGVDLAQKRR